MIFAGVLHTTKRKCVCDHVLCNHRVCDRFPGGRTGVSGRGCLGRWGPNHTMEPIITRWKTTPAGDFVYRAGKPVLEMVAKFDKRMNKLILPRVTALAPSPMPARLPRPVRTSSLLLRVLATGTVCASKS